MSYTPKEKLIRALQKDRRYKFRDLKGICNISNEALRVLIAECRQEGYSIVYYKLDRTFGLSKCPTPFRTPFDMTWLPTRGKLGLVSDTHYCSVAERPDLIQKAYSHFARLGIKTVLHAGDLMDGYEVFRGHNQEVKIVGGQAQAKYVIDNYPKRKGIKTYFISGNHDNKSYEKGGIDQASLVTTGFLHHGRWVEGRQDMVYLGQYSRTLALKNEVTIQILHPHGGSTYAKSYAQQKRARMFKTNDKPSMQLSGHFHTYSWITEDYTQMVALPAFQDLTTFFERLGYPREMGYCILDYKLGFIKFDAFELDLISLT